MKIHGKVTGGQFSNMRELYRQFKPLEGEQVTVTVGKRKAPRTLQQNSYLWAVVYGTLSDYTGYSKEDLHERVEPLLLLRTYTDENGIRFVKPTSMMSVDELGKYIDAVKLWAWHELNLFIPEPQCG